MQTSIFKNETYSLRNVHNVTNVKHSWAEFEYCVFQACWHVEYFCCHHNRCEMYRPKYLLPMCVANILVCRNGNSFIKTTQNNYICSYLSILDSNEKIQALYSHTVSASMH